LKFERRKAHAKGSIHLPFTKKTGVLLYQRVSKAGIRKTRMQRKEKRVRGEVKEAGGTSSEQTTVSREYRKIGGG